MPNRPILLGLKCDTGAEGASSEERTSVVQTDSQGQDGTLGPPSGEAVGAERGPQLANPLA